MSDIVHIPRKDTTINTGRLVYQTLLSALSFSHEWIRFVLTSVWEPILAACLRADWETGNNNNMQQNQKSFRVHSEFAPANMEDVGSNIIAVSDHHTLEFPKHNMMRRKSKNGRERLTLFVRPLEGRWFYMKHRPTGMLFQSLTQHSLQTVKHHDDRNTETINVWGGDSSCRLTVINVLCGNIPSPRPVCRQQHEWLITTMTNVTCELVSSDS